jgi:hypothetical protein
VIARLRALCRGGDRGSAPIEFAITGLVGLLIFAMLVIGARIALAGQDMAGVAGNAARQASIARTPTQAVQIAQSTAIASLQAQHLDCEGGPQVSVDTSGFAAPLGAPATVSVDVTCVVRLSDIGAPGLPGSRSLTDHGISPIDPFRQRDASQT